jgi:hypothetical protein
MPIYVRTEKGQSIAYDAQSDLPLPMRSLLKLIDGKTEDQTYVVSLSAFGNVSVMFARLLQLGYIQEVLVSSPESAEPERNSKFVDSRRDSRASKFNPSRWFSSSKSEQSQQEPWDPTEIAQRSAFSVSAASSFEATVNIGELSDHQEGWAATHHVGMQARLVEHDKAQKGQAQVKQITESMATFLLTQMPERAFGLLSELESIATWQDLRALLDGYSAIISPLGQPAQEHLTYIRQNLVYNLHESV